MDIKQSGGWRWILFVEQGEEKKYAFSETTRRRRSRQNMLQLHYNTHSVSLSLPRTWEGDSNPSSSGWPAGRLSTSNCNQCLFLSRARYLTISNKPLDCLAPVPATIRDDSHVNTLSSNTGNYNESWPESAYLFEYDNVEHSIFEAHLDLDNKYAGQPGKLNTHLNEWHVTWWGGNLSTRVIIKQSVWNAINISDCEQNFWVDNDDWLMID